MVLPLNSKSESTNGCDNPSAYALISPKVRYSFHVASGTSAMTASIAFM